MEHWKNRGYPHIWKRHEIRKQERDMEKIGGTRTSGKNMKFNNKKRDIGKKHRYPDIQRRYQIKKGHRTNTGVPGHLEKHTNQQKKRDNGKNRGYPKKHDIKKKGIYQTRGYSGRTKGKKENPTKKIQIPAKREGPWNHSGVPRHLEKNMRTNKNGTLEKIGGTRTSGKYMKFKKTGHWENSGYPDIQKKTRGVPGQTFKIQKKGSSENVGGTSNFRSNVQNSKKRVIRKFRHHLQNHIKPYKIM